MHRRDFLIGTGIVSAIALAGDRPSSAASLAGSDKAAEAAAPFDFEWLRQRAAALAVEAYQEPAAVPEVLDKLSYEQYSNIHFRPEQALWRDAGLPFQLQLFHPGWIFKHPVRINIVADGHARPLPFSKALFDYGEGVRLPDDLPGTLGFAGFRVHAPLNKPDVFDELALFRGASYFRSLGPNQQYGVSARGLAIDTATRSGEEFPQFREFWIGRPAPSDGALQVYALLDSPGMTGAYRFQIAQGEHTLMQVGCHLFPRRRVEKLGLAPLTSMFLFGENGPRRFDDVRPEVHDSDGLLMANADGEWIWRPLVNPQRLRLSSFATVNPRGFGMLQRDRAFASYQDLGAHYERRPDVWVEPMGEWGKGAVHLVEIPVNAEIHDNIVAFWWPERPPEPGSEAQYHYKMYWGERPPPCQTASATVSGTRLGAGKEGRRKVVIDFVGGRLPELAADAPVAALATATAGKLSPPVARRNEATGGWRVSFELDPQGNDLVEMRCYLRLEADTLSETWAYQWTAG